MDKTELLNKHKPIQGLVETVEGIMHPAFEVRELMNKMLDSVKKERNLNKSSNGNHEATSGLESALAPPIEKLKLGGQLSKFQGKNVEEMFRESVALYILDTPRRIANTNYRHQFMSQ